MTVTLEKVTLIELLDRMIRARVFDEKAVELFTKGNIPGFIHVGVGQEAIRPGSRPWVTILPVRQKLREC